MTLRKELLAKSIRDLAYVRNHTRNELWRVFDGIRQLWAMPRTEFSRQLLNIAECNHLHVFFLFSFPTIKNFMLELRDSSHSFVISQSFKKTDGTRVQYRVVLLGRGDWPSLAGGRPCACTVALLYFSMCTVALALALVLL